MTTFYVLVMRLILFTGIFLTFMALVDTWLFVFTQYGLPVHLGCKWFSNETQSVFPEFMTRNGFCRASPKASYSISPAGPADGSNGCTHLHVRKEWRVLPDSQKAAWVNAVKCLVNSASSGKVAAHPASVGNVSIPHNKSGSIYDDFTYVHIALNNHIHQTGLFLPWHRYFLWSFEQALRTQCSYEGVMPYWDWSQDAADFEHASIFAPNATTGLGGFGRAAHDHAVADGAFARLPLAYPVPHALRREYSPHPFRNLTRRLYPDPALAAASTLTPAEVRKLVHGFRGDYKGFQSYIEGMQGAHMCVHLLLGGDLGGTCMANASASCGPDATWSPNEPLFWLHHGMVDKIWNDWQRARARNFWAFEAGTVRDLDTWPRFPNGAPPPMALSFSLPTSGLLAGNYTIQDMLNTTSNSPLCYVYE